MTDDLDPDTLRPLETAARNYVNWLNATGTRRRDMLDELVRACSELAADPEPERPPRDPAPLSRLGRIRSQREREAQAEQIAQTPPLRYGQKVIHETYGLVSVVNPQRSRCAIRRDNGDHEWARYDELIAPDPVVPEPQPVQQEETTMPEPKLTQETTDNPEYWKDSYRRERERRIHVDERIAWLTGCILAMGNPVVDDATGDAYTAGFVDGEREGKKPPFADAQCQTEVETELAFRVTELVRDASAAIDRLKSAQTKRSTDAQEWNEAVGVMAMHDQRSKSRP